MSRLIFIITHPPKEDGPNPGLTAAGYICAEKMAQAMPKPFHTVCCGMGKRHIQTARALGLWLPDYFSSVFGVPESRDRTRNVLILTDGTEIPYERYTFVTDRKKLLVEAINGLPHQSAVVTSRPTLKTLGYEHDAKDGTIYSYNPDTRAIKEVFSGANDIGAGAQEV